MDDTRIVRLARCGLRRHRARRRLQNGYSTSLFVSSPKGNDQDATGTRDKPFKTLNAALKKIDQTKRRIYVCEGTYPEDVKLDASHTSVSIFGGVDCNWKAAPAIKPAFGGTAAPLKIDRTAGLALADVAFEAKDASVGSSIAALVTGGDVTLKRVRLVAGNGAKGEDGVLVPFTFPSAADLRGNNAPDLVTGGEAKSFKCPDGATTTGGKGGDLGKSGASGTPGTPNPGTLSNCTSDVNGHAGTQPPAASGAIEYGTLAEAGWQPKSGGTGAAGVPGQGGGGGYGNSGGGGGGGAGGCGGAGGPGGKGGGGSIALASVGARVTVFDSVLQAKDGGPGGAGAAGQTGQTTVGAGGNRSDMACNGGNGGVGGDGASGGGGAGGVSIGVLYKEGKPTLDSSTAQSIKLGKKGAAGGAAPSATNGGIEGIAEKTREAM